jgi:hypothetical protein
MSVQGVAASKPKKAQSNGQKCEWRTDLEIAPRIKINATRLRPLSDNQIGKNPARANLALCALIANCQLQYRSPFLVRQFTD